MTRDVHVVAVGARTPLGLTCPATMAAVRAGIGRVGEHPSFADRAAEPVRAARDPLLDPELPGSARLIEMAAAALEEACGPLHAAAPGLPGIPVLLALPEPRPGWTAAHANAVVGALGKTDPPRGPRSVTPVPFGHAAGLAALDAACGWIRSGRAEILAIAGVDSYLELETLGWLDDNRQLATSYNRSGFFPGEAAGAFVVASGSIVQRHGLPSLAVVRGTGTALETRLIRMDEPCLGEGLTACIRAALLPLQAGEAADGIICDINGERYRSEEWGFALLRLSESLADPTGYELPATCWGDVGAASGPLFVAMAVTAGRKGWARGARYLLWNSSEAGHRAAAVLELAPSPEGAYA